MTTFLRALLGSAGFGAGVAAAYWLITKEPMGTILLAIFAAALGFGALYIGLVDRETAVSGDAETAVDGDAQPRASANARGEAIGVFSVESPWPVLLAIALAGILVGVVLHPMLAAFALPLFFTFVWKMIAESR